jgi:undecaprenyl-diphosphatase
MTTIDTAALERQPPAIALRLRRPVERRLPLAKKLLPLGGLGVAVYALLPRVAQASSTLSSLSAPSWPWLLAAAGCAAGTYVLAAVGLTHACGRPLPFGRTCVAQVAAAFTNRVVPAGLGAAATNVRYLELNGLDRPSATTAVAVTAACGFVVHTAATVVVVVLLHGGAIPLHLPDLDATWRNLLALAGAGAVIGWLVWARRARQALQRWLHASFRNLGATLSQPRRVGALLACSAGVSVAYVSALAASLAAFGVHVSPWSVAVVYLTSSAVAAVAPTPGGVGPFEAAAVAGLGAIGVAAAPAVAAVITYRLITYWLPVAPGAAALHGLRRRGAL